MLWCLTRVSLARPCPGRLFSEARTRTLGSAATEPIDNLERPSMYVSERDLMSGNGAKQPPNPAILGGYEPRFSPD